MGYDMQVCTTWVASQSPLLNPPHLGMKTEEYLEL